MSSNKRAQNCFCSRSPKPHSSPQHCAGRGGTHDRHAAGPLLVLRPPAGEQRRAAWAAGAVVLPLWGVRVGGVWQVSAQPLCLQICLVLCCVVLCHVVLCCDALCCVFLISSKKKTPQIEGPPNDAKRRWRWKTSFKNTKMYDFRLTWLKLLIFWHF